MWEFKWGVKVEEKINLEIKTKWVVEIKLFRSDLGWFSKEIWGYRFTDYEF